MRAGLALVVLLAAPAVAHAEGELRARARARLPQESGARVEVGRTVVLEIEARHPPGGVALLPDALELPSTLGERRSARSHTRRREGETEVDVYRLELVPFVSGLVEIPAIPVALGADRAETEPVLLDVASSLDDAERAVATSTRPENLAVLENMAAGDPPPAAAVVADPRPAIALVALAALALAVVLGRKLLARRRARAQAPPPPAPPRPAHATALEALDALERSRRLERGEVNPYFTELSFILRRYLGARYGFDALERTLDELDDAIRAIPTPGLDRSTLSALLFEAEQVKFAKFLPSPEDARAALDTARALIERTRYDAVASPSSGETPASTRERPVADGGPG